MNDKDKGNQTTTTTDDKPLRFGSRGKDVYNNLRQWVCGAKSRTFATRIANALNEYEADERGQ